jgi:hypothetical protein
MTSKDNSNMKYFWEYLKGYSIIMISIVFLVASIKFGLEVANDYILTIFLTNKSNLLMIIYLCIGIISAILGTAVI